MKISVQHESKEKAEQLLNMINVEFSEQTDQIKAITQINDKFGTSQGWFGSNENKEFHIDYQISLPKNITLKLINHYGNIFINHLEGPLDINLKYGDLNINKLTRGDEKPYNHIAIAYGKAIIDQCNWLNLNLAYSKATFQTCRILIVMSKYSKISIDQSNTIAGESAYDHFTIKELNNFVITGKYSEYKINQVSKKIDIDTKYSDVLVNTIPPNFESINVDNAYGKISLGIDPEACYELQANVKYANINYPEVGRVNRITQGNETKVNGTVGNKKSDSKVTIKSAYGGVNLKK